MLRALAFVGVLAAGLCSATAVGAGSPAAPVSLREAARPFFLAGVAVSPRLFADENSPEARLIKTHFNVLTPDNAMKWGPLQPRPGEFNFEDADRFVDFARRNKLYVVGHTLVWHSQTPDWVFSGENGRPPTRDLLLARMRKHIATVVGRYKSRIQAWDVVNEALNDDGTLRDSPWRRIIGDDYIEKAFQYAREADPAAHLYYNDYRLEVPAKRAGAVAIVKRLKAAGLRIDAVGIQGHVGLVHPEVKEQEAAILAFHKAGVKSMITEMDVDVLPGTKNWGDADIRRQEAADPAFNPYPDSLPPKVQAELASRYADFFRMYSRHHDKVIRVTLWGLNDGNSWLNNFPIKGRTNHPLLFDRAYQPKPALHAVIEALRATPPPASKR